MRSKAVDIGFLFSSTGSYQLVSRAMLNGATLAAEQVNASSLAVEINPVVENPDGNLASYRTLASEMLQSGIKHVVGCYTSSSRKEVIPYFEKYDGLLWYPSHYEGFETSENVIYTGATANQHLLPLIDYLTKNHGKRAFCIGSNYIWAWENNRILREEIAARGGSVDCERYFAIGERDFSRVIDAIIGARPDFVFLTLIGTSAYAFFRDFRAACLARGIDQPATIPVASCSLAEPELEEIGLEAVEGHLSSSVYFSSVDTPENRSFISAYAARFPEGPTVSADAEASYACVWLLALALAAAGEDGLLAVKAALGRQRFHAPQGEVRVDDLTWHSYLTPRIGRSNKHARFDLISEAREPVQPDPYLVRHAPRLEGALPPRLRIVS